MFKTRQIYKNKSYKTALDRPKLSDLVEAVNWFRKSYRQSFRNMKNKKSNFTNSKRIKKSDCSIKNVELCTNFSSSDAHDSEYEETSSTYNHPILTPFEKSPGSREHHNLLEKQRREIMRRLLKLLRDILPTHYCQERMSTSKTLQQASYFVKDGDIQLQRYAEVCDQLISERGQLRDLVVKYCNSFNTSPDSTESEMSKAFSDKATEEKESSSTEYECEVFTQRNFIRGNCVMSVKD